MVEVKKEEIVCLDGCYYPILPFDIPNNYTEYQTTPADQIATRLKDATIVVTSRVPISEETLAQCPNLKLIALTSAGTDIVDHEGCRKRGIRLCNIPSATTESVAEHFLALYFAVKRAVLQMNAVTVQGEVWPKEGTAINVLGRKPLLCRHEVLGIVGYGLIGMFPRDFKCAILMGVIGKKIEGFAHALGMSSIIADRRDVSAGDLRPGYTEFHEVLRRSTTLVLVCPLNASTRDLISTKEFQIMRKDALLINVGRGGVVNEAALVEALKTGEIAGAGIDVFEIEPATKTSGPLTSGDVPNLTVSPHIGWYASDSISNIQNTIKENVELFLAGTPQNVVV